MAEDISLDGRTLVGVANDEDGEVGTKTRFRFEQTGDRIHAAYAGGDIAEGHLLGTFDGRKWEIRYTQINVDGDTASGRSVGTVEELADGRVRVEDEWEWESKAGAGESVLEEDEEIDEIDEIDK
ncbi:hypothetical protein [Halobaculum magnesiiphilum]|uniref:Uncharacterized protein n=1 Tax=Halobaculum magnesiiphilum TaxID=1017351 RepID=A0A8T8WDI4_9EURY|nr:hypothetical protein [Halobaculum magnesiiphilum]QZP37908.1 hypothetical protein K6T50_01650 [Halobaculum magnesiiphilum]